MALFLTAITFDQKVIEGSNFNTTLFKLLRKNGFFIFLKFQFFQGQKVNFRKFQGHFFQNSDGGLKFIHKTVLIEHIETCFEYFRNFSFFKH